MVRTALVLLLLFVAPASSILADEPEAPRMRLEGEDFVLTLPEKANIRVERITASQQLAALAFDSP
jgi:hypothetical protein